METLRPIPEKEYELALLQYVRTRSEVRPFLKATGNDMTRLRLVIDRLLADDIIVKDGKSLFLSKKGEVYLSVLNKDLGRKGLYSYFIPDYKARRVQMSAMDTYIPQYMIQRGGNIFSNSLVRGRSDESSGDNETPFEHNK